MESGILEVKKAPKKRLERGILGVKKDPKKKILFLANGRDEEWPSDDSEDSTYTPSSEVKSRPTPPQNNRTSTPTNVQTPESRDIIPEGKIKKKKKKKNKSAKQECANKFRQFEKKSFSCTEGNNKLTLVLKETTHIKKKRKVSVRKPAPKVEEEPVDFVEGPWGTVIPSIILLRIFQFAVKGDGAIPFLCKAAKVCSLWERTTSHPSLWQHVDLSSMQVKKFEDRFVSMCQNKLRDVKEINLSGWDATLTQRGIKAITDHCPRLSSLILSGCKRLTSKDVQLLADTCRNLRRIDLSHMTNAGNDKPVSKNSLQYLTSKRGANLVHISIANNPTTGIPAIVNTIAEHCPNLQLLDLSNTNCTNDTVSINIERLQSQCPKLKVLRLVNTLDKLATVPLSEQASSLGFPELEELSIAVKNEAYVSACGVSDSELGRIVKSSEKLKLLDIRNCNRITSSSLVRIPAWDLEHLFLSQCTAAIQPGIELVMQKWRHSLVEVDLSWNNPVENAVDLAVDALASDCDQSKLESLNLCGSSITLEPVTNIVKNCRQLKVLNLTSCRALPRGIKCLYRNEELEQLKTRIASIQDVT